MKKTFIQVYTGKWDNFIPGKKSSKIQAVKFELARAEGPSKECGPAQPVSTWAAADAILRQWARTAPDEGHGYDKCGFTVTWSDGETYTGRYDLKRHDMGFTNLLAYHIKGFLNFHTGTHQPHWMTTSQYTQALQGVNQSEYVDFLAKYEIGNTQSETAPVLKVTHDPKPIQTPKVTKQAPAISKRESSKLIQLRNIQHRAGSDSYNVDILPVNIFDCSEISKPGQ
jgi:hypothetical protein